MCRRAVSAIPLWLWVVTVGLLPIWGLLANTLTHWPLGSSDALGVPDPDSWLRLTLVRDWMLGSSWYDHSYASNAPYHMSISPWTRPLDLVIAALTWLQPGHAPLTHKLLATALALPLLWMGLLLGALVYAVRRITDLPHAAIMLAALFVTTPLIYNYFAPGNADHHAPLAALFAWVMALLMTGDFRRWRAPIIVGILLALMLWISPEALLLIAASYAWFGLRWLCGESLRPLARMATVVALAVAVAIVIEHPLAAWDMRLYDSISIAQLGPLAWAALIAWMLCGVQSTALRARIISGLLAATFLIAAIATLDPLFLHGPMAVVDPYIHQHFLPRITEARNILDSNPLAVMPMLLHPLLAVLILLRCLRRGDAMIPQSTAALLLFFLLVTLAMTLAQLRWFYYLYPIAAMPIALWLGAWLAPEHSAAASHWPASRILALRPQIKTTALALLMVSVLCAPMILSALAIPAKTSAEKAHLACREDTRRLIQHGALAAVGDSMSHTILAATDLGGELLFFTPHRIVASNYHREGAAIRDVWNAQQTTDAKQFFAILRHRTVSMLIICPDAGSPANAVWSRLYRGELTPAAWQRLPARVPGLSTTPPAIFLVKAQAAKHSPAP